MDSTDLESMANTFFHSTEGIVTVYILGVLMMCVIAWFIVSVIHKVKTWPRKSDINNVKQDLRTTWSS